MGSSYIRYESGLPHSCFRNPLVGESLGWDVVRLISEYGLILDRRENGTLIVEMGEGSGYKRAAQPGDWICVSVGTDEINVVSDDAFHNQYRLGDEELAEYWILKHMQDNGQTEYVFHDGPPGDRYCSRRFVSIAVGIEELGPAIFRMVRIET